MVEGARASTIIRRRQRSVESETPSTTLRVVPPPPLSWGRMMLPIHNVKQRRTLFPLVPVARDTRSHSRDAPWHPRFASRFKKARPIAPNKRRGAERRKARTPCRAQRGPARATRTNVATRPRFGRARLSALHRGTRRAGRIRTSAQRSVPRFLRPGAFGRYPLPPVSVYRAPRRPVVVPVGR